MDLTPNYASPFWTSTNPGTITFADPSDSSVATYTSSVIITMVGLSTPEGHSGNYSGATIDVLNVGGNVIQSQNIPGTSAVFPNYNLTFSGPVHVLRFTHTPATSGALPLTI